MRRISLICFLALITLSGCATARSLAHSSVVSPSVIRADSDQLSDLSKAAHSESGDSKPRSRCNRCKKDPCSCNGFNNRCDRCNSDPCTCPRRPRPSVSVDDDGSSQLVLLVLTSPFTIPAAVIGDNRDHSTSFPNYPYADDSDGSLIKDSESVEHLKTWTGNLQLFSIPGGHNVDRVGGRLVMETDSRFGIDTESTYWFSRRAGGGTNDLWTGDLNLVYRFAESEHFQLRSGIGLNWLADQTRPEVGFNFTYGVDWFPKKPWTVSTVIDLGSLGHGTLFHNRTTVGAMVGPVEFFAGYDFFQLSAFYTQGPIAGVGWRF